MRSMRTLQIISSACLLSLLLAGVALAHKVNIFAYVEGDSVHTESYFNDGRKCKNSAIAVFDSAAKQLLEGETDEEGIFTFPTPKKEDLKIVLTASMGHRAEYLLSRREFGGQREEGQERTSVDSTAKRSVASATSEEIVGEVDRALDRKLAPLLESVRRLEKLQERALLRDVIGGIGYIVGLAGLYYYLRNRRSQ